MLFRSARGDHRDLHNSEHSFPTRRSSELLKLGIEVGQTSIAKYMVRRRGPPSQSWKTFLRNHADGVAAMVPTVSFRLLNGLLIMGHRPATNPVARRHSAAHGGMDCQPTDGGLWLGANPSRSDPRSGCLLRQLIRSSRALGIRDHPISARSPWQNGYAERLAVESSDK